MGENNKDPVRVDRDNKICVLTLNQSTKAAHSRTGSSLKRNTKQSIISFFETSLSLPSTDQHSFINYFFFPRLSNKNNTLPFKIFEMKISWVYIVHCSLVLPLPIFLALIFFPKNVRHRREAPLRHGFFIILSKVGPFSEPIFAEFY